MADRVQLTFAVETSQATADIKKFGATTKTEMASVDAAAKTSTASVGSSANTLSKSFAGAGASISGANAALQLLGRQGPPALQTLASAAASVAISGFGPWSLALAGATGIISLVASLGKESEKTAEKVAFLTESARKQGEAFETVRKQAESARLAIRSLESGSTTSTIQRRDQRALAQAGLSDINAQIAERTQRIAELWLGNTGLTTQAVRLETDRQYELIKQLKDKKKDYLAELREIEEAERNIERLSIVTVGSEFQKGQRQFLSRGQRVGLPQEPRLREATQLLARGGPAGESELAGMISDFAAGSPVLGESVDLQPLAEQLQQRRMEEFKAWLGNVEDLIAERTAQDAGIRGEIQPMVDRRAEFVTDFGRSRAESITSSMASSFAQALTTQDYSAAGRDSGLSAAESLLETLIQGALEGTGIKQGIASAFSAAFGATGGGSDVAPAATGGR